MAFTIKYFRLFEVRIIHEYFLLHEDKLTYFDLPLNTQQTILEKRLLQGQYRLMQDLSIEPTAECSAILKNYRLKLGQTPTGLIIACAGEKKKLSDGSEAMKPEIPLSLNLEFTFIIKIRNPYFRNYTLLPLKLNSNANYLFTNHPDNVFGTGFTTLSKPVAEFQSGSLYYAGDVAEHGGVLKEAYADTNSNNSWKNLAGTGYLNENDRRLYPNLFVYYPSDTETQNPLSFILKNVADNTEIKRITVSNPVKTGVRVDFSTVKVKGSDIPLPNGRYILEKDNSTSTEEKEIYLLSRFSPQGNVFSSGDLGMILIRAGENDPNFRILGDEGVLLQPYPVFQIRLGSRSTFWRYQAKVTDRKLKPSGTASFFVDDQDNNAIDFQPYNLLITKRPQKLAHLPVQAANGSGNLEIFPQPGPSPIRTKPNDASPGRIYSDVYISTLSNKIEIVN